MAVSEDKRLEIVFAEWQYRHSVVWRMVQLWGLVALVAISSPFLGADIELSTSSAIVLPLIGLLLGLVGSWNIASEYERLRMVHEKLEDLRGKFDRIPVAHMGSLHAAAIRAPVGSVLTRLFLFGIPSLALAAIALVLYQRMPMSAGWSALMARSVILFPTLGLLGTAWPIILPSKPKETASAVTAPETQQEANGK